MTHKRVHKGKNVDDAKGARKSSAQTEGQYARDGKGRQGQYSTAGTPPLMKK